VWALYIVQGDFLRPKPKSSEFASKQISVYVTSAAGKHVLWSRPGLCQCWFRMGYTGQYLGVKSPNVLRLVPAQAPPAPVVTFAVRRGQVTEVALWAAALDAVSQNLIARLDAGVLSSLTVSVADRRVAVFQVGLAEGERRAR
jgi:hypothetical protein